MKKIAIPDWQAIFYEEKNVLMLIVDAGDKQVIKADPSSKGSFVNLRLVDSSKNLFEATLGGFPAHYLSAIRKDQGFVLQMGKGNVVSNNVKIAARA